MSVEVSAKRAEAEKPKELSGFPKNIVDKDPLIVEEVIDDIVLRMSTGVPIGKHSKMFKSYEDVFPGSKAVDWLLSQKISATKEEAAEALTCLADSGAIEDVEKKPGFKPGNLYKFCCLEKAGNVLNKDKSWRTQSRNAVDVTAYLLNGILELYKKNLKKEGGIDFETINTSRPFKKWSLQTAELQKFEISKLTLEERRAVFINAANMLVLHIHVMKRGPPKTMLERKEQSTNMFYNIDGQNYSLDNIDTNIFRGIGEDKDPKIKAITIKKLIVDNPNSIFAFSDGTRSTPTFVAYDVNNFNETLNKSASVFLLNTIKYTTERNEIYLPKILERVKKDFNKDDKSMLEGLDSIVEEKVAQFIRKVHAAGRSVDVKYHASDHEQNYIEAQSIKVPPSTEAK